MMLRYKGTYSARNIQIKKPLSSQTATFKLVVTKLKPSRKMEKIELSKYYLLTFIPLGCVLIPSVSLAA